ncbi:MAG: hypothetical protein LUD72_01025 [Bacteroidales bacterium]|nr:hypothetical protein [Bacteroidales bacterium]
MANILTHNKHIFDLRPTKGDYWDFQLSRDTNGYIGIDSSDDGCLVMEIDVSKDECVNVGDDGKVSLASSEGYHWDGAVNNGLELSHIGYTGMDNGLVSFDKDAISNRAFLDLFFNSKLQIEKDDLRVHLNAVGGDNKLYSYPVEAIDDEGDGERFIRLEGGFFQGFIKDCGTDYQVLPTRLGNGWTFEIAFRRKTISLDEDTLNNTHPDNGGIILYIGTRAENKWWERYTVETEFPKNPASEPYTTDGYSADGYTTLPDDGLNTPYLRPIEDDLCIVESYFADDYVAPEYGTNEACNCCREYVKDGYLKDKNYTESLDCSLYVKGGYLAKDTEIDPEQNIEIENGVSLYQPNVQKIETDNKFLIYDRTPEGYTVHDKDVPERITLITTKAPSTMNYFLLFDRTPHGYTTKTIGELEEAESLKYNVLKDIYRNAFAIQVREDGSVGYKYLVKDCDAEDEAYKILSEFTDAGVITADNWHTLHVKITPEGGYGSPLASTCPDPKDTADSMRVTLYLNGKLIFKSKKLPILKLKELDDLCEKQEIVPYNISLGGGTQGLCDVMYLNYRALPKYVLPLEQEFAGSFVGDIKMFRFYNCDLSFNKISGFSV